MMIPERRGGSRSLSCSLAGCSVWNGTPFGSLARYRTRRQKLDSASFVSASRGIEAQAALAFAIADDTAPAESLAQDLNKRWPLDTQIQSLWLPSIQAHLALD